MILRNSLIIIVRYMMAQKSDEVRKSRDPFIYHDKERIINFAEYAEEFRAHLQTLLEEIYDPSLPFAPTPVTDHCRTCPYAELSKLSQQE